MIRTDDLDASEMVRETWVCSPDKPGNQTRLNTVPRHNPAASLLLIRGPAYSGESADLKTEERKKKKVGGGVYPPTQISEG